MSNVSIHLFWSPLIGLYICAKLNSLVAEPQIVVIFYYQRLVKEVVNYAGFNESTLYLRHMKIGYNISLTVMKWLGDAHTVEWSATVHVRRTSNNSLRGNWRVLRERDITLPSWIVTTSGRPPTTRARSGGWDKKTKVNVVTEKCYFPFPFTSDQWYISQLKT